MPSSYRTVYAFAREMHPKTVKRDIQYGTAGFRDKASNLGYVMYRMGLLSVLRARYKKGIIGVMITASHNPEGDNGVKLIDPHGEMMEQSWEEWATKFANVQDDELEAIINEIVDKFNIPMTDRSVIYIGKDTRPSSPSLAKSLMDGILALSGKPVDFGIVTTPQLHYIVACRNSHEEYGTATEEGYYKKLVTAFKKLRGENCENGNYVNRLFYDGANGVGAKKIKFFQERLKDCMNIELYNDAGIGTGKLNYLCGADYVKTNQAYPTGLPIDPNVRCASVDGDADRIVYYFNDENGKFHLFDGDRIATLIASYLKEWVEKSGVDLNLGLVQTAYANGASTEYIKKQLSVPVACVSTGVKHLHHKALEFDIGIYFEANGHGTVVFSKNAKDKLRSVAKDPETGEKQKYAVEKLLAFIDVINETVGDAIADLLAVETILCDRGWDLKDWENSYTDLPNKLMKVTVKDRNVISTSDAERKCVTPVGLQDEIDKLVSKYQKARSFVRSSGTEDIVRVYAEAATQEQVNKLTAEVARAVYNLAGGIGEAPIVPE
ncbi:phosphoacetylglucosamine mutase isoform X2 [Agrilus planipennis]|nr:phosphoacetylglucosamine mutase isoform X2 [Agrilus planipennis]